MADELLDGEFWLPSQFLTDDDILMDFKSDTTSGSGFGFGLTSGSNSDLASLTSDDDELLHYSKPPAPLSGSPQSTLCGWELNHPDSGSSSGSPQKEQPEKEENNDIKNDNDDDDNNKNATLDLLNKAAGEVAKMKLRTERSTGTGFFDCSNTAKAKTLPSPPALSKPNQPQPPLYPPPFYYFPQFRRFPPNMMWGPVQYPPPPQQLQNRVTVTKNNSNSNTKTKDTKPATNGSNNRPLGLPPSAWPPLPGQTQTQTQPQAQPQPQQPQPQAQSQVQPYMGIFVGPQSASVGTGVFLPRRTTTTEPKKKSDGNMMKTKNNKGTQKRSSVPAKTNDDDIQLPLEWVY
ncbi:uncharacterized protein LOC141622190 [Silene latifolia]|uniref:uncharacterized protein LOC141622190 n=1 Tax=Silene latifolia TaxID=37657 RepID=UPI003D77F5E0